MERVALDDLEAEPSDGGGRRWSLTGPLNAARVAINRYVLDPGERFSGSVHAHVDQEEVFLVLEGKRRSRPERARSPSARTRRSGSPPASSSRGGTTATTL